MKIGCCVNMVAEKANRIGDEKLAGMAELGYDYVELPLAEIMALDELEFDSLFKTLKASQIPCEACNNLFPPDLPITGPDADLKAINAYLQQALQRAHRLGAKVIVFGSCGAKNVPEGFSHQTAYEQIVETLHCIAKQTASYPIAIALEPINHLESNIILTLGEALELKRREPAENIGCLVDYYHMAVEQEPEEMILEAGSLLLHTHFANPDGRVFPKTSDERDYAPFFNALKRIDYTGRISIEAFSTNFESDSKAAISAIRSMAI